MKQSHFYLGLLVVTLLALMLSNYKPTLVGYAVSDGGGNLEIEIPQSYTTIGAGEQLWFTVKLLNLASTKRRDVTLVYAIIEEDKELFSKTETVAVETQASFVGSLHIPEHTQAGKHILRVTLNDVTLPDSVSSEISFNVKAGSTPRSRVYWYYGASVLVILLIGYSMHRSKFFLKWRLRRQIKGIVHRRYLNESRR